MIFTSHTYRVAIRRSIQCEQLKLSLVKKTEDQQNKQLWARSLLEQINHTRRLQARKRKERK